MITISHLTKQFGDRCAVADVSLFVPAGECFAFIGPNAAGKTTTIKLMTGLLKPTKGGIRLGTYDIQKDYLEAKRLIGYVPDIPYLYDKLTPREHIHFVLELYGENTYLKEEQAERLLSDFNIREYGDTLVGELSHGTRQKVVFVCMLIHDPRIIIVDEPLVGLDPESARKIKNILKQKVCDGCTVFMSTHTLSDAEELADRIGIIDRGRLIAVGSLDELKQKSGQSGKLEEIFLMLTHGDTST